MVMKCPRCESLKTVKELGDGWYCYGCFHSFEPPLEPLVLLKGLRPEVLPRGGYHHGMQS